MTRPPDDLAGAIARGRHLDAQQYTRELLEGGMLPVEILSKGLMPGMDFVGREFRDGRMFLPQVLVAARAMKSAMAILEPLLAAASYKARGTILLGTVKGDVHDIGKNLVGIMLRGAGFAVVDLGVGCSAEQFLEGFRKHQPDIIGMSALLTTTMTSMKTVIDLFASQNITVPFIVGGAPVNKTFARDIGAAGYGRNSTEAVDLVRTLLKVSPDIDNPA